MIMAAPMGNQFWRARSSHGRKPIFETAADLWEACEEYFQWVEDNPIMATETVKFQGQGSLMEVPKMRAMTITGLCLFLDIDLTTWKAQAERGDDFSKVVTQAEAIIYEQKFTGAAAELLNPNIIARDLGLADKQEQTGNISLNVSSEDAEL